jgi:hypothetical protein
VDLLRRGLRIIAPVAAQIVANPLIIERAAVERPGPAEHDEHIDFVAIEIGEAG